jgi:hypothetical protein
MDADFIVVDTDPCAAEGLNPKAACAWDERGSSEALELGYGFRRSPLRPRRGDPRHPRRS